MLSAVIAAVSAIVIAAFGLLHRGEKHERELAAQELELRSKVDKGSEAYYNLGALLDRRSRYWLNNAGTSLRNFRLGQRFFGVGVVVGAIGLVSSSFLSDAHRIVATVLVSAGVGAALAGLGIVISVEFADWKAKKKS